MNPSVALVLSLLFTAWLFVRDRKLRPMTSLALWIPLLWIMILGSRPVSTWLLGAPMAAEGPQDYLEGSPLDAGIFLFLIAAGLSVLIARRPNGHRILTSNRWFVAFLVYCLVSIAWSDYPFVAFKRFIKDFGNVIMVLIIVTETDHVQALKAVFLRYVYVAIPLSVVFIKYFPDLGRYVDQWTWEFHYCGITYEKNTLGPIAFISGLVLIWDMIKKGANGRLDPGGVSKAATARQAAVASHFAFGKLALHTHRAPATTSLGGVADSVSRIVLLLMVIWLLYTAQSSTSIVCMILGGSILVVMSSASGKRLARHLGTLTVVVMLAMVLLYAGGSSVASFSDMLGRDATLTGRTDLWADLLNASVNPLLGAGYQSFWLGPEANWIWAKYYFHPNQAHNGYLESYLNGGLLGLTLLIMMIASIAVRLRKDMELGNGYAVLGFAFLVTCVVSNWTEATFNRLSLVWLILIVAALKDPRAGRHSVSIGKKREANVPLASKMAR